MPGCQLLTSLQKEQIYLYIQIYIIYVFGQLSNYMLIFGLPTLMQLNLVESFVLVKLSQQKKVLSPRQIPREDVFLTLLSL